MFLSYSHLNVSSFAPNVSAAVRVIRTSCELRMAMFVRPRDYVCAPLQLSLSTRQRGYLHLTRVRLKHSLLRVLRLFHNVLALK